MDGSVQREREFQREGGSFGEGSATSGPVLGPEWWSVVVEEASEVGGSLVMEGFLREEKDFELDLLWDREPAEVLEDGGDVVTGAGVGGQVGSRVLDVLEFIQDFG